MEIVSAVLDNMFPCQVFNWMSSSKDIIVIVPSLVVQNRQQIYIYIYRSIQIEKKVEVLGTQLCPTLCDPKDCSLTWLLYPWILQARILEWVAIPFFRESSWSRDRTWVSCIVGKNVLIQKSIPFKWKSLSRVWLFVTPWTVAHQSPLSMQFSRKHRRGNFKNTCRET